MSDMFPPTTVRSAHPDDLDEIIRLCAAHAEYERADYDPAGKRERLDGLLFGPSPRLFCLVAERADSLVGYATWSEEVSTWDAWLYAHMDCLYLDPDARGSGAGRLLVSQLARGALGRGCRLVQWQTPAFNTRAMRFYDRLGATRREKARFYLDKRAMERLSEPGSDASAA